MICLCPDAWYVSYFSTPYLYQVKKNVELPHPKPNCILQKHRSKFNLYSATKSLSVCPPNPAYNICVFGAGEDRAHDPEWLNDHLLTFGAPATRTQRGSKYMLLKYHIAIALRVWGTQMAEILPPVESSHIAFGMKDSMCYRRDNSATMTTICEQSTGFKWLFVLHQCFSK